MADNTQTQQQINTLRTLQESYNALAANNDSVVEFFGIAPLQGYEFMTDTEVTDELEAIMQALDPELLQEVEYPEGSGTYMTKAQAITAEAMQIINHSQS